MMIMMILQVVMMVVIMMIIMLVVLMMRIIMKCDNDNDFTVPIVEQGFHQLASLKMVIIMSLMILLMKMAIGKWKLTFHSKALDSKAPQKVH